MSQSGFQTIVVPVILSGGSGSRLWPRSREQHPKQLLALTSERTLIQESALRTADSGLFQPPVIVCNDEQRFIVAEQMRMVSIQPRTIIVEPVARSTAAAIAAAALAIGDPEALMLVAPADHLITDQAAFSEAVRKGIPAAQSGALVTFGMNPTYPETGYGYIQRGHTGATDGVFYVARFVEKPDRATAEDYVSSGGFYWNSGIFLFSVQTILDELQSLAPEVLDAAKNAFTRAAFDLDFLRLDAETFAKSPSISIDYAVMERTHHAVVVPATMGWTDIGSWAALWDIAVHDQDGNAFLGDVLAEDSRNCYVDSESHLTAIIGLEGVIVVSTDDATLVAAKDRAQDVRRIVDRLKKSSRREAVRHRKVYRPWGHYRQLFEAAQFEVRHLHVVPGGIVALQKHEHRAEHWVVTNGAATVTRDGETIEVYRNQSVYVPPNCEHRIENRGDIPLDLVEIQSGDLLSESDIVRMENAYGGKENS